jgi:formimidoylglutamate deiminase
MPDFFLPSALLPTGWASQVLLSADAQGEITRVESGARATPGAETLPGVALPGLPNLHSHAFQRALAGLTESQSAGTQDSFWSWRERMYAFLARVGPDDVEAVASQLYIEMLKAGYTSVVEFHYLHHDLSGRPYADPAEMSRRLVAAAERSGLGLTLCPVVYAAGDFGGKALLESQRRLRLGVDEAAELLELLGPSFGDRAGRAARRLGLALHSLRAVPPDMLDRAVELAPRLGVQSPVHIHVAEQRREVEACVTWSGARPVEWLLDHAPVDGRWCLIHATHVTDEELLGIARSGAIVGLCPTTEANLGDGLFPLHRHLVNGGAFGLGSDSHVSVSAVQELRWLEYGQRLASESRNVAAGFPYASTGRTLLERALAGGARAAGARTGELEPGAHADLVVLDPDHPALTGRDGDALLDSWIFSGESSAVRHVVVGGRVVVRDGHHPHEDEVLGRYRSAARRLQS